MKQQCTFYNRIFQQLTISGTLSQVKQQDHGSLNLFVSLGVGQSTGLT